MIHAFLASFALLLPVPFHAPAGAPAPAAGSEGTMLRLRDGAILWGRVDAHDEDGLRFHRVDTGGTVRLPWSYLDPSQAEEMRLALGYVDLGVEEITVDADRLVLVDGTELVGRIVDTTGDALWLKTAEGRIPVPKARVTGRAIVKAPALDVYTQDELYQRELLAKQDRLDGTGRQAAAAHFELARFSEQILDYERAAEHYRRAAAADSSYEADRLSTLLARAEEKALIQEQVDHLAQVDRWRARRQYAKAHELLETFPALYPDSPLMEDWNKVRRRVEKSQVRDLRAEVVKRWHYWTGRLAREAARRMSYEEALSYLDGRMGEEVVAKVVEDAQRIAPGANQELVRRLWEEREGGRWHSASYGYGTWLLGEERARAGLDGEEEADETKAPEPGSAAEAREQIQKRVKRYLENQKLVAKARGGEERPEDDPEAFWKTWSSGNKAQWILAYYVENSGDFRLSKTRFHNCRECGGTGVREVLFTSAVLAGERASGNTLVPCPSCHTIGVVRRVRYR